MIQTLTEFSQYVKLRSQVDKLIPYDVKKAYVVAKSIKHPWYRCQALAAVAEKSSNEAIVKILAESFQSAMECHDSNRRLTVACWPLRVALSRGNDKQAKVILQQCISELKNPMDDLSKWCAVDILFVIKSRQELLDMFVDPFKSATSKGHGWRIERDIKFLMLDEEINKDERYIAHLVFRKSEIQAWKIKNSAAP